MKSLLPLAFCLLLPAVAPAQEVVPDPFAPSPAGPAPIPDPLAVRGGGARDLFDKDRQDEIHLRSFPSGLYKERRVPLQIRLETWEAPALEVTKRLDDLKGAESLAALRAECLAGPEGVRLVHSPVTTADSSTQMSVESVSERIYPTEFEPPSLPCGDLVKVEPPPKTLPESLERTLTSATPTSFETRNTGTSLTAVAQAVAVEEKTWDVAVAFEDVRCEGSDHFGHESLNITMPIMSAFQTGGQIRLKEGQWRLLSVMEPPRGLDSKSSDKRWVTLVRIDLLE